MQFFHFDSQNDFLEFAELISTAMTGIFGIMGVFLETKSKDIEKKGQLNIKGYATIIGLIIGTCFTIWLKNQQNHLDLVEKKAEKAHNDSIETKHNQEYLTDISALKSLASQNQTINDAQNTSLDRLNNITNQNQANQQLASNILNATNLLTYPMEGLTAVGRMSGSITIGNQVAGKLYDLIQKVDHLRPTIFNDPTPDPNADGNSDIDSYFFSTDSLKALNAMSPRTGGPALYDMINTQVIPSLYFRFMSQTDSAKQLTAGGPHSVIDPNYRINFSMGVKGDKVYVNFTFVLSEFLWPYTTVKSLRELDGSTLIVNAYSNRPHPKGYYMKFWPYVFTVTTKNTGKQLVANIPFGSTINRFICTVN